MFLVAGGDGGGAMAFNSTEIFYPDLGTWREGATLPFSSLGYVRAISIANRVLLFGRYYVV